ncbi:MAG TPA: membrane-bound lytic murein transglycosylase MltF [Casimicrobiaceae bacterium]|nr:membrane-bound lytic murein transglycosylase MltF [Casimicrobiaceae bacterium]
MRFPAAASPLLARLPAPVVVLAHLVVIVAAAVLAGCAEPPREPLPADRLVVAVRMGPSSWIAGPDGSPHGFEHDLLARFADEAGLPLQVVQVRSAEDLAARLANGEAHLGLGALHRPADGAPPRDAKARPLSVAWTTGFHAVEPVVVFSRDGYRPRAWKDLAGASVAYLPASGFDAGIDAIARANPSVRFTPVDLPGADPLIGRLNEGGVDYAIVSSLQADIARHIYLNFDVAFKAGPGHELAWLVREGDDELRAKLDAFLAKAKRTGFLARLVDRYFGHGQDMQRIDAGVFQERIRSMLPDFRHLFVEAQAASGIDWRLIAAVAYQESQWDPLATSETGVRGFMQLTEETARHLGVADRLDPRQSILAAARYLRNLKERLPRRIQEPDRTWLALAAFNIGLGHLEDARVLAQRQKLDPDHWRDVKQALPLLAMPEFYERAKLGYARGGMPVAFVDRVRTYYDILLRHEPLQTPRLRASLGTPP